MSNPEKKIFRFKLSDDCNIALADFTQKHHFNIGDRKRFKEDWQVWCEMNQDIIDDETRRLENLGYEGNCISKMFTSVRYYHVKKTIANIAKGTKDSGTSSALSTEKKRTYITFHKEFLNLIQQHITQHFKTENCKPSVGYDLFINSYEEAIKLQKEALCNDTFSDDDFNLKLKKTYKNRYFNFNC